MTPSTVAAIFLPPFGARKIMLTIFLPILEGLTFQGIFPPSSSSSAAAAAREAELPPPFLRETQTTCCCCCGGVGGGCCWL